MNDRARDRVRVFMHRELRAWTRDVVVDWAPGSTVVPDADQSTLVVILRRAYDLGATTLLGDDYRLYRQRDDEFDPYDEAMRTIALVLAAAFAERVSAAADAILRTLRTMMRRASDGIDPESSAREQADAARRDLSRRMDEHSLTIAVTESNWTTQLTRGTAVLAVNDPLRNTVEEVARLFASGDTAGARRLARSVLRMVRLPTSVTQGELIRILGDKRDRLVTPEAQGRILATLRERAERLNSQTKRWEALFRNTRPSHAAAHGQTRPIEEPFQLDGGMLQYPMDGSLGASLSEIINCQCRVVYL